MTSLKKRSAVILFFLLIGIIGYLQIQSASEISVDLSENTIINENQNETDYEIKLKFENPSLLTQQVKLNFLFLMMMKLLEKVI